MTPDPIDHHLDKVLRAAGSGLRHYTMQSTLDAMRTAMSEAMAAGGWQPIETAPHGKKLIAGFRNEAGKWRTILARYYPAKTLYADEFGEWGDDEGYAPAGWYEESETHETLNPCAPTHWRPLPPPPAEGE